MRFIVEILKFLPLNLQNFKLDLFNTLLGGNDEDIKLLSEGLKYLPINLIGFKLDLHRCELGKSKEDMKKLGEGLKKHLPNCI